jgi:hypothetical protein
MALSVRVELIGADGDDESLDEASGLLRAEILDGDVEDVTVARGTDAPEGSKGFDAAAIGDLVVTLAQVPQSLKSLVDSVRQWIARDRAGRSVRIVLAGDELVVGGVSQETQQQLIEAFLRAHSPASDAEHA